jgi:hypothetical protein
MKNSKATKSQWQTDVEGNGKPPHYIFPRTGNVYQSANCHDDRQFPIRAAPKEEEEEKFKNLLD